LKALSSIGPGPATVTNGQVCVVVRPGFFSCYFFAKILGTPRSLTLNLSWISVNILQNQKFGFIPESKTNEPNI